MPMSAASHARRGTLGAVPSSSQTVVAVVLAGGAGLSVRRRTSGGHKLDARLRGHRHRSRRNRSSNVPCVTSRWRRSGPIVVVTGGWSPGAPIVAGSRARHVVPIRFVVNPAVGERTDHARSAPGSMPPPNSAPIERSSGSPISPSSPPMPGGRSPRHPDRSAWPRTAVVAETLSVSTARSGRCSPKTATRALAR